MSESGHQRRSRSCPHRVRSSPNNGHRQRWATTRSGDRAAGSLAC
jgi:hypothetical protein